MALTTVDYNSYFNYKLSTKQITFTDKTDFAGQGTVAANVTVVAKVTAPVTGVFYNNTNHLDPDIDPGTSLDSLKEIALPLDANGLPEQGEYTIELTYVDSAVPATVVDTRTFTLNYTSPVVDISMTVDCIAPLLSAIDNTGYTRNTIDPTITRDFKIHYPASLQLPDVTGTATPLTTSTFYTLPNDTLEHSSSLTSDLSYLFDVANSMYVIDEVEGAKVIKVACDGQICDIYCCLRSQYLRWQDAKNVNTAQANIELQKFVQITSISKLVADAITCGKNDQVSAYVDEILKIANCDAGCSCEDGEPQLVTGLGAASGDTIVVAAGTGMSVTSVSGGGTTTYTVALNSTNVTKLSNLTNTIVSAGTNVSVNSSSATVGGVQTFTYTVNATDTVVDSLFTRVKFLMQSAAVPTISIVGQGKYGSSFDTISMGSGTDFVTNNNAGSFSDWTGSNTDFDIANFGTLGTDYYPEVVAVNLVSTSLGSNTSWVNDLNVDIIEMSADTFKIRFSDQEGNPVNGLTLQGYVQLELIFKIQA